MDKIEVFIKGLQPQHLAISNERQDDVEKGIYRSVCGTDVGGMTVLSIELPFELVCKDCQWQLEHWQKIKKEKEVFDID
jgi:hypothetical protein